VNRVLRRLFGRKTDEVTEEWRKLIDKHLADICPSPHIIEVVKSIIMSWAGHVVRMGERKAACGGLMGKPEKESPIVKPRRRS
jgi:uncharacterized membrane protein